MSRTISRLFAVVLVLTMLAGMATVAQASPPSWAGQGNNDKSGKHFSKSFGDLSLEDYPWAFKHIEKMAAKGIVKGVGNGIFNGNAAIKHEEAVTMIVRYMDLEAEAQAAMGATLPFLDASRISGWARGYVKVALDENLLWMPDASQMTKFDPTTPTTRVEAVVMLVKAAGLEAEAMAKMTETLTFNDAATIPAAYVGYVAVGVAEGLVAGYDDDTFQPFKPVRRSEMATFLGRTDENIPRPGKDNDDEVEGKFVSATTTTITVEHKGQNSTYTLAAICPVYIDDEIAALADLKADDKVELELDSEDRVIFIDAERDDDETPIPGALAGTVKSISIGVGVPSTLVVTLASNAGDKTFVIASNCVIKVDGVIATAADIEVGDIVTLKLVTATDDQLAEILITRDQVTSVTGTVKSVTVNLGTNSIITILATGQSTNTSYLLASDVVVKYNNTTAAVSDIKVGDQVTLTLIDPSGLPLVTRVDIANRETVASGTVTGINYDARTIAVTKDSVVTSYTVSATVAVTLLDQPFTWSQVALDDAVSLTIVDNTVTEINVTVHNASYIGTVKSVSVDATGNHFTATISGVDRTVDVPATAVITHAGVAATFSDITIGATVVITGAFDGSKIVASQIAIQ